jgi:hypothetical protein
MLPDAELWLPMLPDCDPVADGDAVDDVPVVGFVP